MKSSWCIPILLLLATTAGAAEKSIGALEKDFRTLPIEARHLTGPLYWLHGDESKAQLEGELEKVLEGGNGTFTAESRPHVDWLGEGWYRDLGICLDFAKKHKMTMWIFDEKWWPSGEVGGLVPQEYGSKVLVGEATRVEGGGSVEIAAPAERLVAVIAGKEAAGGIDGGSLVDLTGQVKDGKLAWQAPAGAWSVMKFTWDYAPKRRDAALVDGASKDAIDWYIKTVYQPHYDRFKKDFGKTIQGYFYDEPETLGDWGTAVIPLLKARGVDWKKALVAWKFALAGEEQTAAKYQYQDAKAEAWGKTMYGGISEWCRAHGVTSIGHFLEHDWLYSSQKMCAGNMFQMMKYTDMGAIDVVFKQLPPGTRPMGMYQMAKLGSSISHVYGKKDDITMVEIFGARGQDLPYPEMKWQTDQMQASGVNFLIPHSFNPRAPYDRDCPPYFYNGGFEPRYPLYKVFADYTSRLSLMLTGGRHVAPVALLFLGNSVHTGKTVPPEEMTTALQDALFDCDWLPYDLFEDEAKLDGKSIKLYQEDYKVLIVPPVEVIPYGALVKAKEFFERGGVVLGYGFLPSQSATLGKTGKDISGLVEAIWGKERTGASALPVKTNAAGGRSYLLPEKPSVEELQAALTGDAGIHPTLEVSEGKTDNWLHVLHRVKAGRDVFFVTNQNLDGGTRAFKLRVTAAGEPECWDALRNEITAVKYERVNENQVNVRLTLEPYESVLLVFQKEKRALPMRLEADAKPAREIAVERDLTIEEPPAPEPKGAQELLTPPSAPPAGRRGLSLMGCAWIWYPEAGLKPPSAPPGERFFRGAVTLPEGRKIEQARFIISADNGFELKVNGQVAGKAGVGGETWRSPQTLDVGKMLRPGRNVLAVAAVNGADGPNAAGLIGRCAIALDDGSTATLRIDDTWKASDKKQAGWDGAEFDDSGWPAARVVARYGDPPWGRLSGGRAARPMLTLSPVKADPFNGKCVVPEGVDLKGARVYLVCDEIAPEAAGRVTVNGKDAGGFIEKPLRLEVSRLLKAGANTIRIEPFAPKGVKLSVYEK